ncbi:MAG: hypothetical protein LUG24_03450 [Clostridiales bacterium]|nr:hypothetical protein [Clostridiales bacterium]
MKFKRVSSIILSFVIGSANPTAGYASYDSVYEGSEIGEISCEEAVLSDSALETEAVIQADLLLSSTDISYAAER